MGRGKSKLKIFKIFPLQYPHDDKVLKIHSCKITFQKGEKKSSINEK